MEAKQNSTLLGNHYVTEEIKKMKTFLELNENEKQNMSKSLAHNDGHPQRGLQHYVSTSRNLNDLKLVIQWYT